MYLPAGTSLNHRYIIETVLGQGGFGITYAAYDQTVGGRVAIKEYLPRHLATRAEGRPTVVVFTGEARQHFAYGLHKFMEEAQLLKQFAHHANIVSARDFFEAHGTAYMVMEYVEGVTLKEYLEKRGGRISFAEGAGIMMPVMDALREVHQVGLLHRDISPDNIYITTTAQVRVIDFGAARYFAGEQSKSLSVILKPGYAPEEQYHSSGKQGAWTDVYATAATLYRAITGVTPPEALDRREKETLEPPSRLGVDIPPSAERALLKALEVKASQRFQTMGEFQQALMDGQSPAAGLKPATRPDPKTATSYNQMSSPKPVAAQPPSWSQGPVPARRARSPAALTATIGGVAIGLILITLFTIKVVLLPILNTITRVQQEAREKQEQAEKEAAEKARSEEDRREVERRKKQYLAAEEHRRQEAAKQEERRLKEERERREAEQRRNEEKQRAEAERQRQDDIKREETRRIYEEKLREERQREAEERVRQLEIEAEQQRQLALKQQEDRRAVPTQPDRVVVESLLLNPPSFRVGDTISLYCKYTVLSGSNRTMPVEIKISIYQMNSLMQGPAIKKWSETLTSASYEFKVPLNIPHNMPAGNYTILAEISTPNAKGGMKLPFWINR